MSDIVTNAWLVVLTWNGRGDTLELLDGLQDAGLPDTTVVVVDNGSTDGTLEAIQEHHPWAKLVQTGSNLGYAGGNNVGIQMALDAGADVIGVLNNDTGVQAGFWEPLVALAGSSGVAVSPDIRYFDTPDVSWFRGSVLNRSAGWIQHVDPKAQAAGPHLIDTLTLTGCCLVASATTWRTVGLFDERLFLIFEDADWCMRARDAGIRLVVEPRSVIRHKVSRSLDQPGANGLYYFCRNGLIFAARWLGPRPTSEFLLKEIVRPALSDLRRGRRQKALVRFKAAADAAVGRRGRRS